nr:foldase [uncultured bacterium]
MRWAGIVFIIVVSLMVTGYVMPDSGEDSSLTPAPVRSQQGTEADGSVHSLQGGLRTDEGLRRLFDYYLASLGERSLVATRAALAEQLSRTLDPNRTQSALALFDRYLGYRRALTTLAAPDHTPAAQLAAMRRLRKHYFSDAEAQGLFGTEDRYNDFTLALAAVRADTSLDAATRNQRIAELEAALPEDLREARRAPVAHLALAAREQALREQGGNEEDLYRLRSQAVGQAGADRLADLDQRNAAWQNRIHDWRAEQARLNADSSLTPPEREAALARYVSEHFDERERRRLAAF